MEEVGQQGQDRDSPASISSLPLNGGELVPDNRAEKPKDERIVSPNPSAGAAIAGSVTVSSQSGTMNASQAHAPVNLPNSYPPQEQTYFYGGYDDGSVNWGENSSYVRPNNLQVMSPAIYNDGGSLMFHPAYAFDNQVAYSQFSPMAGTLSPIMIDGQLYSPHQVPVSPSYYSQPISPTELATPASSGQESHSDNVFLCPGSGYYLHYPGSNSLGFYKFPGNVGPGESMSNQSTPVGILGPYEHSFGQTPYHGYGLLSGSSTRRHPESGSYEAGRLNRLVLDRDGEHRERESVRLISESHATTSDRNRGPRGSKPKGSAAAGQVPNDLASPLCVELYNRPDFVTTYENAKFFVIKSFSEDNVHRSIKYGVWASTPLGNRKLDSAYQEAKEAGGKCRIFLFFSVNASGQFCGVAEMVGPVDFENNADYWQQDRWSGQFRVQWHIIKDVPNSRFRHILLENNDNKPVTHSRDSQEVKLEQGIAMLKIFKEHDADMSILDDFHFYDEREKSLKEKRAKEQGMTASSAVDGASSISQLSDRIAGSLQLEKHKEV